MNYFFLPADGWKMKNGMEVRLSVTGCFSRKMSHLQHALK